MVVVGMQVAASLIDRASRNGLELGIRRLGADLVAVPRGLENSLINTYITGNAALFYMDRALEQQISHLDWVERTSPQLFIKSLSNAQCCSAWNVFLIAFEPETDFTVKPWLSGNRNRKLRANEILVGAAINASPGSEIRFFGQKFTVAGTLDPSSMGLDTTIFIPMQGAVRMIQESGEKAEKALIIRPDQISAILIKLKPESRGGLPVWKAAYEIEKAIPEVSVIQPSDMMLKVQKNLTGILRTLHTAGYAIWPVTALLIGLVFALAANERKSEIGLLRAIGATRSFIFLMIIGEALFISALGALTGIAVSSGLVLGFSRLIALSLEIPFNAPDFSELLFFDTLALFLALLTGAVSAAIPAYQSSAMEPYEAIRRGE
jgi:putative ABC transport system permease protein